jgi:hypothetical protein
MADASVLGIHPPSTVRIVMEDGWMQDWPWHWVEVYGDELVISVPLVSGRRRVVSYAYEHVHGVAEGVRRSDPDGPVWRFHGRVSFFVTAGPSQAPSLN